MSLAKIPAFFAIGQNTKWPPSPFWKIKFWTRSPIIMYNDTFSGKSSTRIPITQKTGKFGWKSCFARYHGNRHLTSNLFLFLYCMYPYLLIHGVLPKFIVWSLPTFCWMWNISIGLYFSRKREVRSLQRRSIVRSYWLYGKIGTCMSRRYYVISVVKPLPINPSLIDTPASMTPRTIKPLVYGQVDRVIVLGASVRLNWP